jgi:hypothetical protein
VVGNPPTKGKEGIVSYRYDSGFGGQVWVFETKDGKSSWRVEKLE